MKKLHRIIVYLHQNNKKQNRDEQRRKAARTSATLHTLFYE